MYWTYLKILVLLLVLSSIFGGAYIAYRNWEVSKFDTFLDSGGLNSIQTVQDLVDRIKDAPAMICESSATGFEASMVAESYFLNGKSRDDFTPLSDGHLAYHKIVDSSGGYIWVDGVDTIAFFPLSADAKKPIRGFVKSSVVSSYHSCRVWWWPDERVFELPKDKPIEEYIF